MLIQYEDNQECWPKISSPFLFPHFFGVSLVCFFFHRCSIVAAGVLDISCRLFAQSEIAKVSFCGCLQFPHFWLIVFNSCPGFQQNTLIGFSFDRDQIANSFFCDFIPNPIGCNGSTQKRWFSRNHFPTSVTLPTITLSHHGPKNFQLMIFCYIHDM